MLIGDLETDGLLDTVTKIHCGVFYDIAKDTWQEFTPDTVHLIPAYLDKQYELCMHNGIGYDLQVLKKLYNYEYKGLYRDTLLMSRVLWPDKQPHSYTDEKGGLKKARGAHSVENWGIEFKIKKPVHEEWTVFSNEMLHRCKEDVKIQTKLYLFIQNYTKIITMKSKKVDNMNTVWAMEQRVWEIIEQQQNNGWLFDITKAYTLVDNLEKMLSDIDSKLSPLLPSKIVSTVKEGVNNISKAFTQNGSPTSVGLNWLGQKAYTNGDVAGEFCKVVKKDINLNSASQVKDYLMSLGWVPSEYNIKRDMHGKPMKDERGNCIKTTPKIPNSVEEWEDTAFRIKEPAVQFMAKRGIIKHRLGVIKGLITNVRADGRISAQANTVGTNTNRMTHRIVVNIPKAAEGIFYGIEMRSLFKASKGMVQVGCDASALEARCEAHYISEYSPEDARELLEGDIHTKNAELLGITRSLAKVAKYALLYGCSITKLASILGKTVKEATVLYEAYWEGNSALKQLKEDFQSEWKRYGYLIGIDGRPLTVRYEHALINTKFQSAGSTAMKVALCWLVKRLKGYKCLINGNFHDEIQLECLPADADKIGELMVASIEASGRILKFNVPLTGEYKVGCNWAETH